MGSGPSNRVPGITKRAAKAISLLMEKHAPRDTDVVYMSMICWVSDSTAPGFIPGPCLALEDVNKVPTELVVKVHGIKIVFNISPEILAPYQDSILDFMDDRFLFVSKGIAEFLDQN
jgi:hypothetical protein